MKAPAVCLALCLGLLGPVPLRAWSLWPHPAATAIEDAGRLFRAANLSGAAQTLAPFADHDPHARRELLALRFLAQDFAGVQALALSHSATLSDAERLMAARADAARADWPACLDQLQRLPQPWAAWPQSLAAEALQAQGDSGAALAMLRALSLTAGTRLEAATTLLAGEADAARGDLAAEEAHYKQAESADPSYTMVHARLARLYQSEGRLKDARIRLERARQVDPDDAALRRALNALLAQAPAQVAALKREQTQAVEAFYARPDLRVAALALREGEPLVRVGLLDSVPRFALLLGGPYVDDASGRTLGAHSVWQLRLAHGGGWELHPLSPSAAPALRFADVLRLRPLDPQATFGLHNVGHGEGYFFAGREDRYYRGLIELRPQGATGMTLVNELGLEAYLLSVVPGEIRAQWPVESLKAQAIAARTEAWRSRGRFKSKGYDLCPTVLCAVYSGAGAEDSRTTAAVTATAGLVLEDGKGHLAPTFYMHNSGGHTQEANEAWGGGETMPPTATVDAPPGSGLTRYFPVTPFSLMAFLDDSDPSLPAWTRESSTWRWTLRLSAEELEASVKRRHPSVPPLTQVLPLQRSAGGYVQRVLFKGAAESIGSSDYIRSAIKGLKSNLFYVEPRLNPDGTPRAFLFHGGGWGHGVGMAQTGARAMAAAGYPAEAILHHYFGSEKLDRRY